MIKFNPDLQISLGAMTCSLSRGSRHHEKMFRMGQSTRWGYLLYASPPSQCDNTGFNLDQFTNWSKPDYGYRFKTIKAGNNMEFLKSLGIKDFNPGA